MGKLEIKTSSNSQYYFVLKAGNWEVILNSETYTTKSSCENWIDSVRENSANDDNYERLESKDDQYYFNLKAANWEIIGNSETYTSEHWMENWIQSVKENAPIAEIVDMS